MVPVAPAGLEDPGWFGLVERDPIIRALLADPRPGARGGSCAPLVGGAYRQLAFARPAVASARRVSAFAAHHASRDARRATCSTSGGG